MPPVTSQNLGFSPNVIDDPNVKLFYEKLCGGNFESVIKLLEENEEWPYDCLVDLGTWNEVRACVVVEWGYSCVQFNYLLEGEEKEREE